MKIQIAVALADLLDVGCTRVATLDVDGDIEKDTIELITHTYGCPVEVDADGQALFEFVSTDIRATTVITFLTENQLDHSVAFCK